MGTRQRDVGGLYCCGLDGHFDYQRAVNMARDPQHVLCRGWWLSPMSGFESRDRIAPTVHCHALEALHPHAQDVLPCKFSLRIQGVDLAPDGAPHWTLGGFGSPSISGVLDIATVWNPKSSQNASQRW